MTNYLRATTFFSFIILLGGCGPSGPNNESNPQLRSSENATPTQDGRHLQGATTLPLSTSPELHIERGKTSAITSSDISEKEDTRDRPILNVPASIMTSLDSADPRVRYHALDYWEMKGTNAPLDPVFDALEDEDEAVREKAEAIVERRWAEEDIEDMNEG